MKKTIDINKIKEREVSEKEIEANEKNAKKYKLIFYTIPLILMIIIAIIYILTSIHYLLIPFAIVFFVFLFGWDARQRTCTYCKKWNSMIWTDSKIILKTTREKTKNFLGKEKEKNKREKINKLTGKCTFCGKETLREKSKKL